MWLWMLVCEMGILVTVFVCIRLEGFTEHIHPTCCPSTDDAGVVTSLGASIPSTENPCYVQDPSHCPLGLQHDSSLVTEMGCGVTPSSPRYIKPLRGFSLTVVQRGRGFSQPLSDAVGFVWFRGERAAGARGPCNVPSRATPHCAASFSLISALKLLKLHLEASPHQILPS